jgi:transposase
MAISRSHPAYERTERQRFAVQIGPPLTKKLGSLIAGAEILRRLDVAGIIDALCPIRDIADLTHGQVVEAMVANRLSAPAPLVGLEGWAREWAVAEVFGIAAELLNDDRAARALDAIAPELEKIVGTVGAVAIAEFGIDVAKIHWDMTSISMFGAYPGQDEEYPQVKYGHPKDRRVDLKQSQVGLGVTGDGGIPVFHRAYSGGAGEVAQVTAAMKDLQKIAAKKAFLLIGDSKLISHPNVTAMAEAKVHFIAPAPAAKIPKSVYARLDLAAATAVDYTTDRDADRPNSRRDVYHVLEDTFDIAGRRKKDPVHTLRRILVHSTGNARGQAAARDNRLAKAAADLDKVTAGAGGRHYGTPEKIAARIGVITTSRRVSDVLRTQITEDPAGRPTLTWWFDADILAEQRATDGWYSLLANIPAADADAAKILTEYKGQAAVERRYGDFKGPLAVAPMFLQDNKRITALITVICLALLVFSLIEREVRNAIGGDQKMAGLYPDNRRLRPTGRMILRTLASLTLTPATANSPPVVRITRGVQAHLLELLGFDETRPRRLSISTPMCEVSD